MFVINEDKSIYVTRGDTVIFSVAAENENGEKYIFKQGEVLRIKVFEKKACENVVMQKDFAVEEDTESVEIILTGKDTKIGEVISKPTDYWYEVELNPYNNPQTIIGYDDEGAKVFKLYPEGRDTEGDIWEEDEEGEIPNVDSELDATSKRPVQNQAIVRAISDAKSTLKTGYESADKDLKSDIESQLKDYVKTDDAIKYVKSTDYATKTKAGVVKVGSESMGVMMNADNTLVIASAGVSEIQAMASANRPITPYYLKHAVKTGLVNNDLEWSDEEKANSRGVIGAIGRTDVVDNFLSDATDLPASARTVKELNNDKVGYTVVTKTDTDLNDYETGVYYFSSSYTPINIPVGVNGWLFAWRNGTNIKQIWSRQGTSGSNDHDTYIRTHHATSGWSPWTKVITERDIASRYNRVKVAFETRTVSTSGAYLNCYSAINNALVSTTKGSGTITLKKAGLYAIHTLINRNDDEADGVYCHASLYHRATTSDSWESSIGMGAVPSNGYLGSLSSSTIFKTSADNEQIAIRLETTSGTANIDGSDGKVSALFIQRIL